MLITEIIAKKNLYTIRIGDSFYDVCEECFLTSGLKAGTSVTDAELSALLENNEYIICRNYLLKQISTYYKTEKGYRDKLYEKKFSYSAIKKSIDYALDKGYINDRRFAERYYERFKAKKGKNLIISELKNKGVSAENLTFLSDVTANDDIATNLARKYMKNKEKNLENKNKLIRSLASKGFGFEEIYRAVNEIFSEF